MVEGVQPVGTLHRHDDGHLQVWALSDRPTGSEITEYRTSRTTATESRWQDRAAGPTDRRFEKEGLVVDAVVQLMTLAPGRWHPDSRFDSDQRLDRLLKNNVEHVFNVLFPEDGGLVGNAPHVLHQAPMPGAARQQIACESPTACDERSSRSD